MNFGILERWNHGFSEETIHFKFQSFDSAENVSNIGFYQIPFFQHSTIPTVVVLIPKPGLTRPGFEI
jgi:hypothetical protein